MNILLFSLELCKAKLMLFSNRFLLFEETEFLCIVLRIKQEIALHMLHINHS